jgi:hypothetical protein
MKRKFKFVERPWHWQANNFTKSKWFQCFKTLQNQFQSDNIRPCRWGFIVNDVYIITPKKKWKFVGGNEWYTYETLTKLVKELNKDCFNPEKELIFYD